MCLAAARTHCEHLARLEALLATKADIMKSEDHHQLIELDQEFHELIAERSEMNSSSKSCVGFTITSFACGTMDYAQSSNCWAYL